MLSFKQFLINETSYYNLNLTEELTPAQKKFVDDNFKKTGRAEDISGHVIPHGVDRITIPLEGHGEKKAAQPHPDVVSHLKKHGYSVDDYVAGTAKKEGDKRVFKIGKVLNSTNAPKEIHNTFQNDPARAASKSGAGGLHVVISRHPHDVAGMSTNQGWASCMTMGSKDEPKEGEQHERGGMNQHYLQHDVERGTHVAYLARSDDPEAKKPLARIALKPFEPLDKSKKTILRPESRTYGTGDNAFEHTVKKWAQENFPADPETDYNKNSKLYHDAGTRTILGKAGMAARRSVNQIKKYLQNSDDVTPEEIHAALDHPDKAVRRLAASHINRNSDNITKALNDPEPSVRADAVARKINMQTRTFQYHPAITKEHVDKAVNDRTIAVRSVIAEHPHVTKEHLAKLLNDKDVNIQRSAIRHKNTSPEMIEDLLNHADKKGGKKAESIYSNVLETPHIKTEHVERMLKHGHAYPLRSLILSAHHGSADEHRKKIMPADLPERMMQHSDPRVRAATFAGKPSDKIIHRGVLDTDAEVRREAIRHTDNQKHIDLGVKDSDAYVRKHALEKTNNPEHISHALRNEKEDFAIASAVRHKLAKKEDLQHVVDNHPSNYAKMIARNQLATD